MLEIRLLGGFALRYHGREIALRPGRAQSLLVYLLLNRETPQTRSRIAGRFWPDTSEAQARTNLRRELHSLGQVFPQRDQYLLIESRVLQWKAQAPWRADVVEFEAALAENDPELALQRYGGELLQGTYEDWLQPIRERLHILYGRTLERCAELRAKQGDFPGALTHLRALLDLDPLREDLYRQMMALCLRSGNRGQVETLYRECSEVLQRELDLEPDPETREFYQLAMQEHPGRPAPPPALVGRTSQWQAVTQWLESGLRSGFCRLLLVSGEPGIGKSRLLEELKTHMLALGGTVMSGRGFEAEQIRAYGPWLDALKDSDLLRSETMRASGDRSELFDPVVEHLRALARPPGLLLILDDLHWFDEASLALLHYATRLLSGNPHIHLACTARTAELSSEQARRTVASLKRDGRLSEVYLAPLSPVEVKKLVTLINPQCPPERVASSGGNPLFALELARGADFVEGSTLAQVISARLDRLEPLTRELVSWGAVLGRSFTLDTLARVCARPLTELLEAVAQLEEHGLWSPTPEGYDFAHDVVREAAYQWLSAPRRRLLHLQVAKRASRPSEIARHADLGGDAAVAAASYLTAAEESLSVLAFSEAAELARLGLKASLTSENPLQRLKLLRTAVLAGMANPELEALEQELSSLSTITKVRGIAEEEALLEQVQSIVAYHLNRLEGLEASSLMLVEKARLADRATAARMVAHSASCLVCVGRDMPRAEAVALEAEELARQANIELADLEHSMGMLAEFQGELESAKQRLERAVLLSRRQGEPWQTCMCLINLACLELELRNPKAVLRLVEDVRNTASPLKDESELAFAALLETLAQKGDPTAFLATLRCLDSKRMLAYGHRLQAQRCLEENDLEGAELHARAAFSAAETMGICAEQALSAVILVRGAYKRGDRQAASLWIRKIRKLPVSQVGPRALEALRNAVWEKENLVAKIVVEVDWPQPLTDEELTDKESRLMRCIGERGGEWLNSLVSPDRQRTICLFEAPDAESMREAYRRAGVDNARIWPAEIFQPTNA